MADTRLRLSDPPVLDAPGGERPAPPVASPPSPRPPPRWLAAEAGVVAALLVAGHLADGRALAAAVALGGAALAGLRLAAGARAAASGDQAVAGRDPAVAHGDRAAASRDRAVPASRAAASRDRAVAAVASGLVPVVAVAALARVAPLSRAADAGLLAGLLLLGLVPFLAASAVPMALAPGLSTGRRDAVVPALLGGAALATVATLAVLVAPAGLAGVADPRLAPLAPFVAVGMAGLGLGSLLVHHAVVTGRARTPAVLAGLALASELLLAVTSRGPAVEAAVDGLLGGAAVLVVGLVVATTAAAPFPFRLPPDEAGDGPRLLGPALVALTVAALAVRVLSLRPLWVDEAATARLVAQGFGSMLRGGLDADAHPPLFLALAWLSRRALGDGALPLRLPSLLAGTALVPALYTAGRELYGRRTGLAAAVVGALGPPLVWYSVEARPEALAALLAVVSLVAAVRAVRRGRPADWVLLGVAEAAVVWSHQLGVVHVTVLTVAVGAYVWRERRAGRGGPALVAGAAGSAAVALAAAAALVAARSGLGPPHVLLPLEFATPAAPGGGRAVFPILSTALTALLGFHPPDVTSRLLAFWPLGILAALLVLGRARSPRAGLLLALAAAPFAALLATQVAGAPRQPAFALTWAATALPILALLGGRALSVLGGGWSRARVLAGVLAGVLLLAVADQAARVKPAARFDVRPALDAVAAKAGPADLVAYEPRALGDLVAYEVGETPAQRVEAVAGGGPGAEVPRVFVVGAFALGEGDVSVDRTVDLVRRLSATRPLLDQRGQGDVQVWVFGPPRPEPRPQPKGRK